MLGQAERLIELRTLFEKKPGPGSSSKIFAFTSGKGGTGKTFLSLNIASQLAAMNKKVLYVDMDLNMANAHLMLDINPHKTLFDFFSNRALLEDIIFRYKENFHLIFGDSGKIDYPDITDREIGSFFNHIENLTGFDIIILDLPAGAGKNILNILSHVDYAVIVAATEPTAVMDAYALSKLIRYENVHCEQHVIINKSRSTEEGKTAFSNLNSASQQFLKKALKFLASIDYSNNAHESVCSQKLVEDICNNTLLNEQIKNAACKLTEITQLANIHQPAKISI